MNILQIPISDFSEIKGGIDKISDALTSELTKKHKVTVFVPGDWRDNKLSSWQHNNISFYKLRLRMPYEEKRTLSNFLAWLLEFPKTLLTLKKICRDNKIDIIHSHMGMSYQFYFLVLRLIGGPRYLLTLHGSDVNELFSNSFINRLLIKAGVFGATKVNCVSRSLSKNAYETFNISTPHIYNGLDICQTIKQASSFIPSRYNLPERYFVIVGSFDPYKGHDIAIQAWQAVVQQQPDLHLLIVGDGILKSDYLAQIEKLNLGDHIQLLGQLDNNETLGIISRSIGMIAPSRKEGLGYMLLEAGALSVPLIVSDIPPFREIVETDNQDGLLFKPEDHVKLAEKIILLANNISLQKALASNIYRIVSDKFDAQKMAHYYLTLYESCLNS